MASRRMPDEELEVASIAYPALKRVLKEREGGREGGKAQRREKEDELDATDLLVPRTKLEYGDGSER